MSCVVYHATMLLVVVISMFLIICDAQETIYSFAVANEQTFNSYITEPTYNKCLGEELDHKSRLGILSLLKTNNCTWSYEDPMFHEYYTNYSQSSIDWWLADTCKSSTGNFSCTITGGCLYEMDGKSVLEFIKADMDVFQDIDSSKSSRKKLTKWDNAIPSNIDIVVEVDFVKGSPYPVAIRSLKRIDECVAQTSSSFISLIRTQIQQMCSWVQTNCSQSIKEDATCKLSVSCSDANSKHLSSHLALINVESWNLCPGEMKGNQKWCRTRVGTNAFPCQNPCLDTNGKVISRRCILVQGVPKWSPLEYVCTNATFSNTTMALSFIKDNFRVSSLENVSDVISRDTSWLTDFDVDMVAHILSISANQNKIKEYKTVFFQIVNNLHDVNRSVLKSAREFGSTDKILKSIDKFLVALSVQEDNISLSHIAFEIVHPKPSNQDDAYILTVQDVSAKIPTNTLNTSILTIFKNDALFPEGNIASDVVDLKVLGVNGALKDSTVSMYLKSNSSYGLEKVVCSFWKYNEADIGNWSTEGVETVRINDNLVECRSNHLTAFALLGISDRIISKLSPANRLALRVITAILCFCSLVGLAIIFVTCFTLKKWYKKRINTLQLSCVIALEIIMLFLNDLVKINDGLDCQIFGAFMHYTVLVKFVLMLLIAKIQYDNYVTVLMSKNKSRRTLFNTLITFIMPVVIVALSVGLFPQNYNPGDQEFCYPKNDAFRYFVIIPVALILFANFIIFSLVMLRISRSITRDAKQKILQTKLAVMLFFMLGLTWIFSLFAHVFQTQFLKLVFVYVFSILSALQGFVIFVFTVIMDSDAKAFWTQYYRRVYTSLDKESTNTAALSEQRSMLKNEDTSNRTESPVNN